jgi:hypothetical protein
MSLQSCTCVTKHAVMMHVCRCRALLQPPACACAVCSVVISHAISFCHLSCRESNWLGARGARVLVSTADALTTFQVSHHTCQAHDGAPSSIDHCRRAYRMRLSRSVLLVYFLFCCVAHPRVRAHQFKRWISNCSLTCFFYRCLVSLPEVCACVLYTVHTLRTVEHVSLTHPLSPACFVSRCPLMRSALYTGERRPKTDPHFDALGDIDELNSYLGTVRMVVTPRTPCTNPCLRFLHWRARTTPL